MQPVFNAMQSEQRANKKAFHANRSRDVMGLDVGQRDTLQIYLLPPVYEV